MGLEELLDKATHLDKRTVAVAVAEGPEVIEAIVEALKRNLVNFQLFGNRERIQEELQKIDPKLMNNSQLQIYHADTSSEAVDMAIKAVHQKEASVLMKGHVPTAVLLKAVLNKQSGLRTGQILSHVAVFEIPDWERLLLVTDAALNLTPDLDTKVHIINNSVQVARSIGIKTPLVAPLAAVEVINPSMQATVDAAILSQMNRRGQILHCEVDGPLALDIAISQLAAEQKRIRSNVAGRADILLVPNIEAGNLLYKSLVYFARAKVASIIMGAQVPIVLTSRADTAESKVYSLALALSSAQH